MPAGRVSAKRVRNRGATRATQGATKSRRNQVRKKGRTVFAQGTARRSPARGKRRGFGGVNTGTYRKK